MDIFLADAPYNVRKDQKDDHVEYDVLGSNDMKNVAKVLGDAMKAEAHGHVFCSTLQLFLLYKACAAGKKGQASTREGSRDGSSASEKSKSVKLRPAFEVENSALHNIREDGNYQQTTDTNCATDTAVVDMAIHFWRLGASWAELLGQTKYGDRGKIVTKQPFLTNKMKNIPLLPPDEGLFSGSSYGLGKTILPRWEEKLVEWRTDLIFTFCKMGELAFRTSVIT